MKLYRCGYVRNQTVRVSINLSQAFDYVRPGMTGMKWTGKS